MKTENIDIIIKALKCNNMVSGKGLMKCEECPYRTLEEVHTSKEGYELPPADTFIDGVGYWSGCDYEGIDLDAAEVLERFKNG